MCFKYEIYIQIIIPDSYYIIHIIDIIFIITLLNNNLYHIIK